MTRQSTRTSPRHRAAAFIFVVLIVSLALVGAARAASPLDTSFGSGGKVFTDFTGRRDVAYDMVIQPDGKIVVVGVTSFATGVVTTNFGIVRYNSDGTLDSTFGTGGRVSTDFTNTEDVAYGVALQPDGKLVVVGSTLRIAYNADSADFAIARYNSDGTLDSTFGSGGKVIIDFINTRDEARAVVIQPDNRIVIGGSAVMNGGGGFNSDFALVRLNSAGSFDTTFDVDGKLTTNIPGPGSFTHDDIRALALAPDGKIVAAGSRNSSSDFTLARYNPNGSLDTTFDTDGMVVTDFFGDNNWDSINAMVIQPDGKILTVGTTNINYTSAYGFALVRYNSDGSLDTTFGGGGKVFTQPAGGSETASDVALTADGKILVAGYSSMWNLIVARYLGDGNLDPVFGARGRLFYYLTNHPPTANAVAIQADGKILVAGDTIDPPIFSSTDNNFIILRYKANQTSRPTRSDFDGDGRSDIAVFRPSTGIWYVLNSSNGAVRAQPFGTNGDIAAPGDYDGDSGVTDFAVFRPSSGTWYILNSHDNSFRAVAFGATGDIPVAADYDGDAKTDLAVYRPSNGTWYILRSSDDGFQAQQFGTSTDRPVQGFYDGDEKVDLAVFRDSTAAWYIMESSTNTLRAQVWGQSGDIPAAEDYGIDGKFDYAVFRPSTGYWFIKNSADGDIAYYRFGTAGDKPVPGDFTGDSFTDIALWRPSDGNWYFFYGRAGFGTSGDTPVLNAYLP